MTNRQQIADDLGGYIRAHFDIQDDDPDFGPDVHLYDYGYVDSFGAEELLAHVEKTYGVTIDESTIMRHPLNTIREIADFVAASKGEVG
jgi:acyl carrier protein